MRTQTKARANHGVGISHWLLTADWRLPTGDYSKAHHFLKLNRLAPAHFNFFAAFDFKKQPAVKIGFNFLDHPEVDNMFPVGPEEYLSSSLSSSALSDFRISGLLVPKEYFGIVANGFE